MAVFRRLEQCSVALGRGLGLDVGAAVEQQRGHRSVPVPVIGS